MNTILVEGQDFQKARNKIKEAQIAGKTTIFTSNSDDLNRKILEKEKVNILLLNMKGRKDRAKQRDSGFNQVLAKLAKKKSVVLGINLDEIFKSNSKEKSEILARIRQNIILCNKNKLKMTFISKTGTNTYDLKSLGLVLGMPTWMTKEI
jgi:RNase P/RNase MRP subunit p30